MFLCAQVSGNTDESDALSTVRQAESKVVAGQTTSQRCFLNNEKHCLAKIITLNAKHVAASTSTRANNDSAAKAQSSNRWQNHSQNCVNETTHLLIIL